MYKKLKGNTLLAGSAVYLFSNILNAAIPFMLIPVLTRYLGTEGYGQVGMFQTLLSLLAAFVGLNVFGLINRKYYEYGDGQRERLRDFMASCLQILVVSTLLVFLVVISLKDVLSDLTGLRQDWVVSAVLVAAFLKVIQVRLIQWQIRKQSLKYGALQVSQSLTNVSLSIVFVVVMYLGVEGRIGAQVLTSSIFFFLALYYLKRDHLLKFLTWKPECIAEALRYGLPLVPHIAGLFLLNLVDRFVISDVLGVSDVGIYMVAVQITMIMTIVFDAINKAYVPWLFERLSRNLIYEKVQIVKYTYLWYLVIFVSIFFAFVLGPFVVKIIAGSEFERAGELVGWLALGQGFGGMYLMVTNYIHFSKRTGMLSLATIISGIINVILLIVLVRFYGLLGAAQAFSIAMGIRFLLTWLVAQKRYPMPWFNFRTQS